jgi:hypothetical protein
MIKNAVGDTVLGALDQLRASLKSIDRYPELAVSAARLSQIILEIEEWAADQILADDEVQLRDIDRKGAPPLS